MLFCQSFQLLGQVWTELSDHQDTEGTSMDIFGESASFSSDGKYAIVPANIALAGTVSEQLS